MKTANQQSSSQTQNQAAANVVTQMKGSGGGTSQFEDRRPEESVQRKLIETINDSPQETRANPNTSYVVQRARVRLRPLDVLGGVTAYRRQKKHLSSYPESNGKFHAHIFFNDRKDPPNIGFHSGGLFQDDATNYEDDTELRNLHDGDTRNAVGMNDPPGTYKLFSNNCQHWIKRVLATIKKIQ